MQGNKHVVCLGGYCDCLFVNRFLFKTLFYQPEQLIRLRIYLMQLLLYYEFIYLLF